MKILLTLLMLLTVPFMSLKSEEVKGDDLDFIQKVAEKALLEIELGKMASERAVRPEVKAYADQLVKDQTKIYYDLKGLVGLNADFPQGIGMEYRKKRDIPARRAGENFDLVFLDQMKIHNDQDIEDYAKRNEKTKQDRLKAVITSSLPILKLHKDLLNKLQPGTKDDSNHPAGLKGGA